MKLIARGYFSGSDAFLDGVWLVELQSLGDPALVLQTAASILGVHEDPNRALPVTFIETLREKNLLLILDHCDHLLGACTQFAETILQTCPDVRILANSRQPLNIPAEKIYSLVD